MFESIQQAAFMTVHFGWFVSLVLFVPLWGPQVLFPAPTSRPITKASFRPVDFVGLIPAALIALGISNSHPQWVSAKWVHGTTVAGSFFGIMLWVQTIRFANRYGIDVNKSRALLGGVIYPLSIFAVSYVLMAFLLLISSVIKYEPAALPYIIVSAISLVFWLLVALGIRILFSRFTGIALSHKNMQQTT